MGQFQMTYSSRRSMKKTTVWHDIIKLIKTIDKEKILQEASSRGKNYYIQGNKDMDTSKSL